MPCQMCDGVELIDKCPQCGRLPRDPNFVALVEVQELLKHLSTLPKHGTCSHEVFRCLQLLTGVCYRLMRDKT